MLQGKCGAIAPICLGVAFISSSRGSHKKKKTENRKKTRLIGSDERACN